MAGQLRTQRAESCRREADRRPHQASPELTRPTRIVVVGGSIGGLTAALTLRDAGFDVDVFERSHSDLQARGAGILAHPATLRYFSENRLLDLDSVTVVPDWHRYVGAGGRLLHREPAPYRFAAWNMIYRPLRAAFDADRHHLGESMTGFEQDERAVSVRFESGRVAKCDLLVCADGIASTARGLLAPAALPVYSGYVAWRGTAPESALPPAIQDQLDRTITYHVRPNSHVIAYPIPSQEGAVRRGERLVNFVWYRNVGARELRDLLTDSNGLVHEISVPPGAVQPRHLAALAEAAEELPELMRAVLAACPAPFIQSIVDVESPRMAFGRVCLIGDAAFTARPHAGAGTAKASADGWALAAALTATGGEPVSALRRWEPSQLELGRRLVARNREIGERFQVRSNWAATDPIFRYGLWEPGDAVLDGRPWERGLAG